MAPTHLTKKALDWEGKRRGGRESGVSLVACPLGNKRKRQERTQMAIISLKKDIARKK
jgi:hypothetical protein